MINASIIGGAGYTAGELIRLLLQHPEVQISSVHSRSQAGKPVSSIHMDLVGETDLFFTDQIDKNADVVFLCLGHGHSKSFLKKNRMPADCCVIDLSQDFRIKSSEHDFIYGLPEFNRSEITTSKRIANCGCFATAIQLALLPLAKANALKDEVHITAITGSTGAGVHPTDTTHFSWRNNNVSVYKAFRHQHLQEIGQSIAQLQTGFDQSLNFIPIRGNFTRGILATVYTNTSLNEEELLELYETYYASEPFVWLTETNPHLKQVVNTNKCLLYPKLIDGKAVIISTIDNLLKGASGQAVQNMNIAFGLKESMGLGLKSMAY